MAVDPVWPVAGHGLRTAAFRPPLPVTGDRGQSCLGCGRRCRSRFPVARTANRPNPRRRRVSVSAKCLKICPVQSPGQSVPRRPSMVRRSLDATRAQRSCAGRRGPVDLDAAATAPRAHRRRPDDQPRQPSRQRQRSVTRQGRTETLKPQATPPPCRCLIRPASTPT